MGELVPFTNERATFGSFRTVTDGGRTAPSFRTLPKEKPSHVYAAVKDSPVVHMVGTEAADHARAVTYTSWPQVAAKRNVWAADLSGDGVTEDLTWWATRQGIPTLHWNDVSPTRLIEAARHRPEGTDKAAGLVVASMVPPENPDDQLRTTREVHMAQIFDAVAAKEPRVPLLGGAYNALGAVLFGATHGTPKYDDRFDVLASTVSTIRSMYASPAGQRTAAEVLAGVHDHMAALLRGDTMSEPEQFHTRHEPTFFNWGIRPGSHSGARARLLGASIESLLADPDGDPRHPKPDDVIITGAHRATAETLHSTQAENRKRGARTYFGFSDVTPTTTDVVGSDRAILGSTGGYNGPNSEKIADAVGKYPQQATTSVSTHFGGSQSRDASGRTMSESRDETVTVEARHGIPTHLISGVEEGAATLVQGKILHRDVPFRPDAPKQLTTARRRTYEPRAPRPLRAIDGENSRRSSSFVFFRRSRRD